MQGPLYIQGESHQVHVFTGLPCGKSKFSSLDTPIRFVAICVLLQFYICSNHFKVAWDYIGGVLIQSSSCYSAFAHVKQAGILIWVINKTILTQIKGFCRIYESTLQKVENSEKRNIQEIYRNIQDICFKSCLYRVLQNQT